jgi:hypothetical protein
LCLWLNYKEGDRVVKGRERGLALETESVAVADEEKMTLHIYIQIADSYEGERDFKSKRFGTGLRPRISLLYVNNTIIHVYNVFTIIL